jgi:glycosyltransferase involved in cell wall biosynthesis
MRRQKRLDVLLQGFAVTCNRLPEAVLVLAGDGPERVAAERLARELGIADRVQFLGYRRDVRRVWEVADVAVLASDYEGTPLALLEAMASGVPAIATSVGGVPDIVHDGVNGILVPPGDPERLGLAMADLLADKSRRRRLSEGALATAANFGGNAYVRQIEDLYGSLLASSSRRTPDPQTVIPRL